MELKEKLRALRQKCNMTQETVAEHLGISAQTVSKWERGLLAPDIMLLPKIAVLYRCSIDSLFSMESSWDQKHTKQFHEKIHNLHNAGDYEGVYQAWLAEIELRPDNFHNYVDVMLLVKRHKMFDDAHVYRMLLLADYAKRYCTNNDIQNEINRQMLIICSGSPNPEIQSKAAKFYQKLPLLRHSRELYAKFVMSGDAFCSQVKQSITLSIDQTECLIRQMITPEMPPEEKLFYYRKAAALYEVLLDNKFAGFYDIPLLYDYKQIAQLYMELDRCEEAEIYVKRILQILKKHFSTECRQDVSALLFSTSPRNCVAGEHNAKIFLRELAVAPELQEFKEEISAFAKRYNDYFSEESE